MNSQVIYFQPPSTISNLISSVGTIPGEIHTNYIQSYSGSINELTIQNNTITSTLILSTGSICDIYATLHANERSTFRTLEVISELLVSTGASCTVNSDLYATTGKINILEVTSGLLVSTGASCTVNSGISALSGSFINVSCTSLTGAVLNQINQYINTTSVYSSIVTSVVSILIKSANNSYYIGSGFFIDGPNRNLYSYILTAAHVIIDPNVVNYPICNDIWINTSYPTNSVIKITSPHVVMGIDKIADIALIRLSLTGTTYLESKDSRTECEIGDSIYTVGFPAAIDAQSISKGIIRDNKSQLTGDAMESVVTDISIYGGNSGGPLVTSDGKVVAIVSYGYTNTGEELNGGVSSYLYTPIINYFFSQYLGSIVSFPKGYLGIQYDSIRIVEAAIYSLPTVQGYIVTSLDGTIVPAKFSIGDIITEIEGVKVGIMNDQYPLFTEIHLRQPGTQVTVKYRSSPNYNSELSKVVTLSSFNSAVDYPLSNWHSIRVPIAN